MANVKSAMKRNRQSLVRNARNRACKSAVQSVSKKLAAAIESNDKEATGKEFSAYTSQLDKAYIKGVLTKNTVNRRKSRASASIAKMT